MFAGEYTVNVGETVSTKTVVALDWTVLIGSVTLKKKVIDWLLNAVKSIDVEQFALPDWQRDRLYSGLKNSFICCKLSSMYFIKKKEPLITELPLGSILEILGSLLSTKTVRFTSMIFAKRSVALTVKVLLPSLRLMFLLLAKP